MNDNKKTITCESFDTKSPYYLLGTDKLFNNYKIKEIYENSITINPNDYKDYFDFKIDNRKLYYQNPNLNKKTLKLSFTESYEGIALLINNEEIYDKYRIYEIKDNEKKFILESSDFIIISNKLEKNHSYFAEAYKKAKEYYLLVNTSDETKCEIKEIKNTEYELTIGIPVFNGENFISRTINSIILSSNYNYKILIVNDGSTDKTQKIIEWYSNKYDFIEIIKQTNHGAAYSRNVIIDKTETPYMAFLDSDDMVNPNMYKYLLDAIKETASDIAICKTLIREDDEKTSIVLPVKCDNYKTYSYEDMAREHKNNTFDNIFFVSTTDKIAKTSIVKKVRFPKKKYYEDSAFTPALYSYANKFVFVEKATYIWDQRKRKTEGTFTTEYSKVNTGEIIDYYFDATIYPIYNCNKENSEYVVYSALKDLLNYFAQLTNKEDPVYINYERRLKELINSIDIRNKYILEDKDIKKRIIAIL